MKNSIAFILLVMLLSSPALPVCASDAGPAPDRDNRRHFVEELLTRFSPGGSPAGTDASPFPVADFVKGLGMPDESVVADDEYCLLGQLHRWCLSGENIMVVLLGDTFSSTIDYGTGSRMFALRKCRDDGPASFREVWGIRLGDADSVVKERLERLAEREEGTVLSVHADEAPVLAFLSDLSIRHRYLLRKGGFFFYFIINKNGFLEAIVLSGYDVMKVC